MKSIFRRVSSYFCISMNGVFRLFAILYTTILGRFKLAIRIKEHIVSLILYNRIWILIQLDDTNERVLVMVNHIRKIMYPNFWKNTYPVLTQSLQTNNNRVNEAIFLSRFFFSLCWPIPDMHISVAWWTFSWLLFHINEL